MRFYALAFAASAAVLGACGGEKSTTTTDTAATSAAAPATTDSATAGAAAPAAGAAAAVAAMPATGTTHEVKMIGDDKGYRFEPADLPIKAGDAVKFTMVSGGPHNVAFVEGEIAEAGKAQLTANIPNAAAPLTSQMVMNPNETIVVSFAGVAPGKYGYNCTPHASMGMKGAITVQ